MFLCYIPEWEKGSGEPPDKRGDKPPKAGKQSKKKDKKGKKPKELRENPDFEDIEGYGGTLFGKDSKIGLPHSRFCCLSKGLDANVLSRWRIHCLNT